MIDIHCHPLPETDDGAKSVEVALAMLQMSAEDGVTHVVATPHCSFRYAFDAEENKKKAAELQAAAGDAPKILLGCDFHLSYDNIRRLTEDRAPFTINGTQYVLVEFDDHFIPQQMDNVFYEIQMAGFTPILTHPERNAVCRRRVQNVYNWVTRGCLVQVTAQSYMGGFGSDALHAAEQLLDLNMVHIVASDAHDTRRRPPLLSPAYEKLATARGKQLADLLFTRNPEAIIQGKPLPPSPPPISPQGKKGKKKWWPF
ncbi:MAG TPA: CpsB/CapC family capsule biosynthesis tyrosine phosphatase [Terriglobia bacterium]|nr:CpsB/CapC family capsule biosynthesis tyrosine phosphatase [Terriglobia bacterium]